MVLQERFPHTFSQIFDLNSSTADILAELGYRYRVLSLSLPCSSSGATPQLDLLGEQMRRRLPHVPLATEAARRAFYVTPVLFAALDRVKFRLLIGYRAAGRQVQGEVDYLLRGRNEVVVTGTREADLTRGFTQMAAQMIAVCEEAAAPTVASKHPQRRRKAQRSQRAGGARPAARAQTQIYGAVTTGTVWRFGLLDKGQKRVMQDTEEYLLPRDLERLVGTFAGLMADDDINQVAS
jgi:acylphosphatase